MGNTDLTIDPVTPAIGAEIGGIELSQPLDPETLDAIYRALIDHLVIFFRDQDLTPAAHLAFAESFGEIDRPHPVYPHVGETAKVVLLESGLAHGPHFLSRASFCIDPLGARGAGRRRRYALGQHVCGL
jgi:alpha-ketoglutarate-dependent taurine dioxygenase